jgi:hypothetical protein
MAVTENFIVPKCFKIVQIKRKFISGNTTEEMHPLSVHVLCNMCLITPQDKGSS